MKKTISAIVTVLMMTVYSVAGGNILPTDNAEKKSVKVSKKPMKTSKKKVQPVKKPLDCIPAAFPVEPAKPAAPSTAVEAAKRAKGTCLPAENTAK